MLPASTPAQFSTTSSMAALIAALELFRELRSDMPIQLPLVFMLIAQHKGISAARLGRLTGLSQSAVSRNVTQLTKEGSHGEPGLGLITKTIDPANTRAHAFHLTADGRAMAARLAEVLGKTLRGRRGAKAEPEGQGPQPAQSAASGAPEAFAGAHWEVWAD